MKRRASMLKSKFMFMVVGLALVAAAIPVVVFAARGASGVGDQLAEVRQATVAYHDVAAAEADGYVSTVQCAASPAGGMGIHYMKPSLVDRSLDIRQPEVLLYEPAPDGKLRLVAVEYMIPTENQTEPPVPDATHPQLFGRPFDGPMLGHGPGQPVHYDLHAWVWQANPAGTFAEWNPNVRCPAA